MERRKCRTGITKQNRTDFRNESSRSYRFCKADSVITWVWLGQRSEFAACFPVKLTAVYNDTTDSCTMSTDEFCCGMYHDISTVFNRANQIRSSKCIVNCQWNFVSMCNVCQFLNIHNI